MVVPLGTYIHETWILPLVEIGGQHMAPNWDVCSIFFEGEHTRTSKSTKQNVHQYPT